MTSDKRKAAEEAVSNELSKSYGYSLTEKQLIAIWGIDFFLLGRSSALKELEQIAREAFEAGRAKVGSPDWDYAFETFESYWQKKTESKEVGDD